MAPQLILEHETLKLQNIRKLIDSSSRIVVITGAGVSTNYGIPDFRSKHGLNSQSVKQTLLTLTQSLPNAPLSTSNTAADPLLEGVSTKDQNIKCATLFDASSLSTLSTSTALYRLCALLNQKVASIPPNNNSAHAFIAELYRQQKLVRCYTQNIDGLETMYGLQTNIHQFVQKSLPAGLIELSDFQVVQLHGDIQSVRCSHRSCMASYNSEILETFLTGSTMDCSHCVQLQKDREIHQKRPSRLPRDSCLRPNIVLYNEDHPLADHIQEVVEHDIQQHPDLLLIIGTSLKVYGARNLLVEFADIVHTHQGIVIFVNRDTTGIFKETSFIDYAISIDCDDWSRTTQFPQNGRTLPRSVNLSPDSQEQHSSFTQLEHQLDDKEWLETYFELAESP